MLALSVGPCGMALNVGPCGMALSVGPCGTVLVILMGISDFVNCDLVINLSLIHI